MNAILSSIWKFIVRHPKEAVIIMLVAIIFFMQQCRKPCKEQTPTTITHIDTLILRDTIKQLVHTNPQLIYEKETIYYGKADTAAILRDYNIIRCYTDTLRGETYRVAITDTIFRNKLQGRSTDINVFHETSYITRVDSIFLSIPQNDGRTMLYVGGGLCGNTGYFGLMGNVGLSRNGKFYSLGYDPLNKIISANMLWKIKLRN